MRVLDKNAPTDLDKLVDKFWFELGGICFTAWVNRRSDEVVVEEMAKVVEALKAPGANEAGRAAYTRGIFQKLNEFIAAADRLAKKKRMPSDISFIGRQLSRQMAATPLNITVVPRAAKTVTRKTVESYTKDGRIASMIEEQVEV